MTRVIIAKTRAIGHRHNDLIAIDYRASLDTAKMHEMARKAANSKGKKCVDGALLVEVLEVNKL